MVHLHAMGGLWREVSLLGNDIEKPSLYWGELLRTMPTEPEENRVVRCRDKLVTWVAEENPVLTDVRKALDTLAKYGKAMCISSRLLLGLHPTSDIDGPTVVPSPGPSASLLRPYGLA
tara:strand:- start:774 stop:1127 length:354 start_codon:yes stop_codon:yes gene_type:complete